MKVACTHTLTMCGVECVVGVECGEDSAYALDSVG